VTEIVTNREILNDSNELQTDIFCHPPDKICHPKSLMILASYKAVDFYQVNTKSVYLVTYWNH